MSQPRVAGLVLAAGAGRRMGGPKAELVLDGHRLIDRCCATMTAAGCAEVLAVVRPGTTAAGFSVVGNPDADSGMRSSLTIGLAALPADIDAVAVVLVDVPGLTAEAVRAVVAGWRPGRVAVAVTGEDGVRTHPTVMSPALWREAVAVAAPDEGARAWLRQYGELIDVVRVEIDPTDLDTPADLAAWRG